jgi:hypothetical protein
VVFFTMALKSSFCIFLVLYRGVSNWTT